MHRSILRYATAASGQHPLPLSPLPTLPHRAPNHHSLTAVAGLYLYLPSCAGQLHQMQAQTRLASLPPVPKSSSTHMSASRLILHEAEPTKSASPKLSSPAAHHRDFFIIRRNDGIVFASNQLLNPDRVMHRPEEGLQAAVCHRSLVCSHTCLAPPCPEY